jgi:hypothetical protein
MWFSQIVLAEFWKHFLAILLTFISFHCNAQITVNVVALVAYSAETIMPAINLAAEDSNKVYGPELYFNRSIFGNVNPGDFGSAMQSGVSNYLADLYYKQRLSSSYIVFLPTGKHSSLTYHKI